MLRQGQMGNSLWRQLRVQRSEYESSMRCTRSSIEYTRHDDPRNAGGIFSRLLPISTQSITANASIIRNNNNLLLLL